MGRKRILIVEDEAHTATILYRALNDVFGSGYRAHICPLGEAALSRLREEAFDLVVTDLCMPGMSGLELMEEVRQSNPETPVLVITAFGTPEVEGRVRQLGAAYLAKPFSLQDFVATVDRILYEAEPE
jgi:DNA-binding response OmpR family regulator